VGPDDEVVALITGNGVKTPDAKWFGVEPGDRAEAGGLVPVIDPSFAAFSAAGIAG
jgi:threonine synthase